MKQDAPAPWMLKAAEVIVYKIEDASSGLIRLKFTDIVQLVAQIIAAHCPPQIEKEVIPGTAGVSPCAACGKGMDGAFEAVVKVGGKWYHAEHAPNAAALSASSPPEGKQV